jgi:hypothetical protein
MVSHQRPRQATYIHLRQQIAKAIQERQPVVVIQEYIALLNPSHDHVLEDSGYVKACGAWHVANFTSCPSLVN